MDQSSVRKWGPRKWTYLVCGVRSVRLPGMSGGRARRVRVLLALQSDADAARVAGALGRRRDVRELLRVLLLSPGLLLEGQFTELLHDR